MKSTNIMLLRPERGNFFIGILHIFDTKIGIILKLSKYQSMLVHITYFYCREFTEILLRLAPSFVHESLNFQILARERTVSNER